MRPTSAMAIEARHRADQLREQLKQRLTENQWGLVFDYTEAERAAEAEYWSNSVEETVEAIARHFPHFAPSIRAVYQHVSGSGNPRDCGLGPELLSEDGSCRSLIDEV